MLGHQHAMLVSCHANCSLADGVRDPWPIRRCSLLVRCRLLPFYEAVSELVPFHRLIDFCPLILQT